MRDIRHQFKKNNEINAEKITGKMLPANIEAEKAVLGAVLLNDDNLALIIEYLGPEDFYLPAHQVIYTAITQISRRSERIDVISVQDELTKQATLEKAGGTVYLLELQEDIPAVGLVEQHAKIIKEKAILRELINSAAGIIS